MRPSPKTASTLRYLLITFVGLLIFLGYYWYSYIPSRENYFTNRNLRLLSEMSDNISKVIGSYKGQLDKNFINPDKSIFQMFIDQGNVAIADLLEQLPENDCLEKGPIKDFLNNQTKRIRHLSFEGGKVCLNEGQNDTPLNEPDYHLEMVNGGYSLKINYCGDRTPSSANNLKNTDTFTYSVDLRLTANLKDIISPFLKPDIFDNILLVEHAKDDEPQKRVIYQADQSAFRASRLDSLTSSLKESWSSYHEEVVWGNDAYQLFVQPVSIALKGFGPDKESIIMEWMLVGLVDAGRFNADARAISRFSISQWTFFFFLLLCSIPLIKLNFVGAREELKRWDVIMTVFSIYALSGILTFWLISNYSDREVLDELDAALTPF